MSGTPRTAVVGRFYDEAFALHIAETLEQMGHQVARLAIGVRYTTSTGWGYAGRRLREIAHEISDRSADVRRRRFRRLAAAHRTAAPELTIVCHDFLLPDEIAELRSHGGKVVMWFPDAISNLGRLYFLNAPYDACFFKDPYIVGALRPFRAGGVFYLPEAYNPARHAIPGGWRGPDPRFACDITTAGNMHSARVALFAQLADYEVRIWGNPPPRWLDVPAVRSMYQGKYVVYEEKARAFRSAKVVLNSLHPAEVSGLNARAFEAAGIGAFQVISHRPELEGLFDPEHELVSFVGIDDLRAKLDRYLAQPRERAVIASAGQRRAAREHKYSDRLALLLKTVRGDADGFHSIAYGAVETRAGVTG